MIARCFNGSRWECFTQPYPVGYSFRWYADGEWRLTTTNRVLASGTLDPPATQWHQLKLSCQDDIITAYVDGREVVQVQDATYAQGLVGIAGGFYPTKFDNMSIH